MTNIADDQIQQARKFLEGAQSILIATRINSSVDAVASSLSFYLALSTTGKQVSIISPSPMTVEFSHLVGVDKIKNSINGQQGRNLVISFPYQEGSIEKVSYNIEGNSFNLVIEPREGYPTITSESVKYSHNGGNVDLILTINTPSLSDLDNIYTNNQTLFQNNTIINIDSHAQNARYGNVNLVNPNISSTSELTYSLLSQLGFIINPDISSNILEGISDATQNFTSPNTNAATFEIAAICLRNGARKPTPTISTFSPLGQPKQQYAPIPFPKTPVSPITKAQTPRVSTSIPLTDTKTKMKKPIPPISPQTPSKRESGKPPETPPDWLKPKIYRGSTLL